MKKFVSLLIVLALVAPVAAFAQEDTGLTLNPVAGINVKNATITGVIAAIIRFLLGFSGVLGLIFFIWGGFLVLLSGGNQDKVKKGYKALTWSLIGLFVVFSSYFLLNTVIRVIENSSL